MTKTLDQAISVSRQFLRSINLEADLGRSDALRGYICQETALSLIKNMALHINTTRQRAFTWTGPYGGGKSSLALLLGSLVSTNKKLRDEAKKLLGENADKDIEVAWKSSKDGWLVLPIVGKRDSAIKSISLALDKATNKVTKNESATGLILRLTAEAEKRKNDGVLLILDELGKFLESAAQTNEDIYFYQELAEAASRSKGKLIIIGILHQSFEQYALRLGREARDEWAKIQGRFIDIPLIVASDEVIELVGKALEKKQLPKFNYVDRFANTVSEVINSRRATSSIGLKNSLMKCWPLHPITASLLGPISRKKFSQNERSVFGFLASAEPLGFMSFLKSMPFSELALYSPSKYWDYLKANMEQAIISSPDGHRWVIANDAIERTESRDGCAETHIRLIKTIALIDLFKSGSGLAATNEILEISIENVSREQIKIALQDLARWSIVIYRKHLDSWAIYSGSDFDIDASINQARAELGDIDVNKLSELSELNPVVAKKHYHETGNLRWFNRTLIKYEIASNYISSLQYEMSAAGEFILIAPNKDLNVKQNLQAIQTLSTLNSKLPFVVGYAVNSEKIYELGMELSALEKVHRSRRELEGDAVAKKEINSRISILKAELSDELKFAFENAMWFCEGEKISASKKTNLSVIASNIALNTFPNTPNIFNELVNKDSISGNATRARKDLMYRMLSHSGQPNLGYEGFSADASLFYSIIENNELYQWIDGRHIFITTDKKSLKAKKFQPLWNIADKILKTKQSVTLDELFNQWRSPKIGARKGVLPIFALVYFLANRHMLGLYIENTFIPELTEAYLDEWMQDPKRVAFKFIQIGTKREEFLLELSSSLGKKIGKQIHSNPLESARALVNLIITLPNWTKRTSSVSPLAQEFKKIILKANDPYKVLFADIPLVLEIDDEKLLVNKISELTNELQNAYPSLLDKFKELLFKGLDHSGSLSKLNQRAEQIKGASGDFHLDAFIARLSVFNNSPEDLEGLLSSTINKNPKEWIDRDVESAINSLGEMCARFRKIESLALLRGKSLTRKAFAFVYADPKNSFASDDFDVSDDRMPVIKKYTEEIMERLSGSELTKDEKMAIFSEACNQIMKMN